MKLHRAEVRKEKLLVPAPAVTKRAVLCQPLLHAQVDKEMYKSMQVNMGPTLPENHLMKPYLFR